MAGFEVTAESPAKKPNNAPRGIQVFSARCCVRGVAQWRDHRRPLAVEYPAALGAQTGVLYAVNGNGAEWLFFGPQEFQKRQLGLFYF